MLTTMKWTEKWIPEIVMVLLIIAILAGILVKNSKAQTNVPYADKEMIRHLDRIADSLEKIERKMK